MKDILIIGYGNADRQDDGVAWHVLSGIARHLGFNPPSEPGEPFEANTANIELVFSLQLFPELAEDLHNYRQVIFVDAHTGAIDQEIAFSQIFPEVQNSPFTHHLSPQMLLSITRTIYANTPEAFLLSIRAHNFQFSRELSSATAILCEQATDLLWQHLNLKGSLEDQINTNI